MTDRESHERSPEGSANRREFLSTAALAGFFFAKGGSPALRAEGGADLPGPRPTPLRVRAFDLEEATVGSIHDGMKSGKYTAHGITEQYLTRIEELNHQGPALHAVIETNPDAMAIADALDAEWKAKGPRGPLHGIPVLIKDNIATADRMTTTAGSLALEGSIPLRDSFVAERLRAAGAIILGKANLSEWANFRGNHSSSGWSGRGGQAKNPYALDRNPCGSSSGSGVAASANLATLTIGTETDGSIVCPSSINGVVGIKPTIGLWSRSGIIPIAHSQDTAGPMCRTVSDAAILLGAVTGVDPRDSATGASRGHAKGDYTSFLDPNGLKGARIGVARKGFFGSSLAADRVANAAIEAMKQAGAIVVDPADLATNGKYGGTESEVLYYEFKADLNKYLAELGPKAPVKSMKDVIEFNEKNHDSELKFFGQELMIRSEGKGPLTEKKYLDALAKNRRMAGQEGIDATMAKYRLDAIVAPTAGPSWLTDHINGDHDIAGSSSPAAVAGYPSITVPAGFESGLPIGISFFGRAWSEGLLIKLAYGFEQATKARKAPKFLPSAEI